MIKTSLFAVFILLTGLSSGQIVFGGLQVTEGCGEGTVTFFENWRAYQTLDDTYDGQPDPSICISLIHDDNSQGIYSQEIDLSRPVFLRYTGEPVLLDVENYVYMLGLSSDNFDSIMDFGNQEFCVGDFCSGSLIDLRIPAHPDSATQFSSRRYTSELGMIPDNFYDVYCSYTHCIPTEYFDQGNVLEDLVLKFIFRPDFTGLFDIDDLFLEPVSQAYDFTSFTSQTDQFSFMLGEDGFPLNLMVLRPESSYPDHFEYVDFSPIPNVDTVATVSVSFGEMAYVVFQPYVDLRGGLVSESEEERHGLELINEGATFCLNAGFIELQMTAGDSYRHRSGKLDFRSRSSCLRFDRGSRLIVEREARLHYGNSGQGTLALAPGCKVTLMEGAEFVLDNRLVIRDEQWEDQGLPIDIELPPFTRFTFGPEAYIENLSRGEGTRIRFLISGGEVDLSGLSAEDLQHVELVYPETETVHGVRILTNPVSEDLRFSLSTMAGMAHFRITDIQGKVIDEWRSRVDTGITFERRILPTTLGAGVYSIDCQNAGILRSGRFVID